jgi:hypothetical protein
MNVQTDNEQEFKKYLLGDMADEEYASVEATLVDDQSYERFFVAEQTLIENYLTGQLSSRERQLFEDNYLDDSIERLEKVAKTKAVLASLANPELAHSILLEPPDESWRAFLSHAMKSPTAFISYAAGVLIVSISIVLYFKHETSRQFAESERTRQQLEETTRERNQRDEDIAKLKTSLEQLQRERDELAKREEELTAELEAQNREQPTVFLSLSPFGIKGPEEEKPQLVGKRIKRVIITLELRRGLSYEAYRVRLNGTVAANNLRAKQSSRGSFVTVQIPVHRLIDGSNSIELSGRSNADEYQKVDGYSVVIDKR